MKWSVRPFASRSSRLQLLPGAAGAAGVACALAALTGPGCGGRVVVDPLVEEDEDTTSTVNVSGSGGTPTTSTTTTTGIGGAGGTGGAGGSGVATLSETDLGPFSPGMSSDFDVPDDTLGFSVIVRPADPFGQLGVESLVAPSGQAVIADYIIPPTDWMFAWYGMTVAAVPQSDAPPSMPDVMSGPWTVGVNDPTGANQTGDVSLWLRRTVDGQFHGGELDVNVFVAGGVTSKDYLVEMLLTSYDGYAGLHLGQVTFYDLPPQYAVISGSLQFLEALEQTAAAERRPALNILAIADLAGELENAAGVAAGIPGQGVQHGSHSSGVVMEVFNDYFSDSVIMEHEGGHLGGLFHTSEIAPPAHDPLGDTGYCTDVEGQLESCPDFDNIMFPFGSEAKQMTPMQERVLQGSLLYRGIYAEGLAPEPPLPPNASVKASAGVAALQPVRVVDLSARSRGARRPQPQAPSRAWAAGLPRGAAEVLSGVWCRGQGLGVDHHELLRRAGGDDPVQLLMIGADASAPVHVRKRALAAAGRAAPPPEVVAALADIAETREAPRQVRIGALRGLEAAGGPEAAAVAQRLGGADPILAEVARRVLQARP